MAVALSLLLPPPESQAQEMSFPERPDVRRGTWYVDKANMIAEAEGTEINGIASKLMADEQIPLIVVTIPSLMEYNAAHYTNERYAAALFDEWGIGSQRPYDLWEERYALHTYTVASVIAGLRAAANFAKLFQDGPAQQARRKEAHYCRTIQDKEVSLEVAADSLPD